MNHFSFLTYNPRLNSILDVIDQMEKLDSELQNTDLENLKYFNHTYLIITRNVIKQFTNKYFSDDHTMEKFDIQFARYYFDALKHYLENKPIAPAWQVCFDTCKNHRHSHTIYMALGINAHVNNDLAFALYDIISDSNYRSDFNKINEVIYNSIPEVLDSLAEKSFSFNTIKYKNNAMYLLFLKYLITKWRDNAWNNFLKLGSENNHRNKIQKNAKRIAIFLSLIKI